MWSLGGILTAARQAVSIAACGHAVRMKRTGGRRQVAALAATDRVDLPPSASWRTNTGGGLSANADSMAASMWRLS